MCRGDPLKGLHLLEPYITVLIKIGVLLNRIFLKIFTRKQKQNLETFFSYKALA